MMDLEGKCAVVVGAGGIGTASALAFARAGAKVAIVDVVAKQAEAAARSVTDAGGHAVPIVADQAEEDQVIRAVDTAIGELGGVDILHNNAALLAVEHIMRDDLVHQLDVAVWDRTMAVNLRGYMLFTKHVIPPMIERGGGAIINTASAAALVAEITRPAYAASKGAIMTFTRNVAAQYGSHGIRCNAVAPGMIRTPAVDANLPPDALASFERQYPLGRLGRPEDVANIVVFLASELAGFVTGVTIPVDGGFTMHTATYLEELELVTPLRQD
jgi:NAD(P)-dependent dehydrogenase (short-subunit alcohol dehydrogenase family)